VDVIRLVREGTLDAELAALLWLLVGDGVPLIVAGDVDLDTRSTAASALLDVPPEAPWVLLDADRDPPDPDALGARLRGGMRTGLTLRAAALPEAIGLLVGSGAGLSEDAVKRLGLVLVIGPDRRVGAAHYLRPIERDAQGHIQRRPPAVLAARDQRTGELEHFAWAVTPELADRVDRSQADLEGRQAARTRLLTQAVALADPERAAQLLRDHLASEPPREPAPRHEPARPNVVRSPLTDPHVH
jgi:hypothetical protein